MAKQTKAGEKEKIPNNRDNPLNVSELRVVGPPGIEPRSTVPETVVLSIELQALLEGRGCRESSPAVNTAMKLCPSNVHPMS